MFLRYDYPADPNAASVLVNNLDLTVRWLILCFGYKSDRDENSHRARPSSDTDTLLIHTQISAEGMGGMLLQGNGFKDAINTVETIAMESMPAGSVSITVTATAIFSQVR